MRISGVWKLLFLINGNYHYSLIVWYLIPGNQNLPENSVIPTKNALIFDWIQQFFDLQKQNLSILISIKKNPTREKTHILEKQNRWEFDLAIGSSGRQNCVFDWKKNPVNLSIVKKWWIGTTLWFFYPKKTTTTKFRRKNQIKIWIEWKFSYFSLFLSFFPCFLTYRSNRKKKHKFF